ncbi:shikimate kinase [Salegentibacter chungangensis]|uniref:Shikimate kinase n=1 Tax=Salegentibacter chungangensis TaxID=1335724 RepID=A0ABW3NV75_9FLAO
MKIFIAGYMGSGKSVIGKQLAEALNINYVDLDNQIEIIEGEDVNGIFEEKGELYFRKLESRILQDILNDPSDMVVSLGGGTPCYGNNFDAIKDSEDTTTIYLKASVETLTARLAYEKVHRPVISHLETKEQLEEFIRKHLFERAFYYNQSDYIIDVNNLDPEEIVGRILKKLD